VDNKAFIREFYEVCKRVCPSYGLKAIPAIVSQACLESNYGASKLSSKYHNYWGMKCGSSYKGKSVNMTTQEEYEAGTKTTIKSNFRSYNSIEDGVKGYCEFITGMKRYKNLIGVTDDNKYIELIKADGWATDSKYVTTIKNILPTVYETINAETPAPAPAPAPAPTPAPTPAPSAEPTPAKEDIKKAQDGLNKMVDAKLAVDGVIGALTRKATAKALQYALNRDYSAKLIVDGAIGDLTRGAYDNKFIKKGSKSYLVSWAEIALMLLGYYNSTIELAGSFGAGMDSATIAFQEDNGLKVDGAIGKNTINTIIIKLGL
jgi:peptidoglycan hydrolase-like protein with peptidoglycan-binding domain